MQDLLFSSTNMAAMKNLKNYLQYMVQKNIMNDILNMSALTNVIYYHDDKILFY